MKPELVGQQIRLRILEPSRFKEFRTKDVGSAGRLQLVLGYDGKGWMIQSYRFNLKDYPSVTDVLRDANTIKGMTSATKDKIASLTRKYFHSING
jgi:hypothetical protein